MASDTLKAFLSLGLEHIPDDWVSQLWSDNFCESSLLSIEDHDAMFSEANWKTVARCLWLQNGWIHPTRKQRVIGI